MMVAGSVAGEVAGRFVGLGLDRMEENRLLSTDSDRQKIDQSVFTSNRPPSLPPATADATRSSLLSWL